MATAKPDYRQLAVSSWAYARLFAVAPSLVWLFAWNIPTSLTWKINAAHPWVGALTIFVALVFIILIVVDAIGNSLTGGANRFEFGRKYRHVGFLVLAMLHVVSIAVITTDQIGPLFYIWGLIAHCANIVLCLSVVVIGSHNRYREFFYHQTHYDG